MRFGLSRVTVVLIVVSTLMLGTSFGVSAQEGLTGPQPFAKQGTYLAITGAYNEIGGDFDGQTVLSAPTEIVLVPEVQGDWGWGISFGGRGQKWAGELTYLRSKHDITFLGAKGEAVYNQVSLDFKRYFLVEKRLQPYLLFGWIPYAWLVEKDGSASATDVGDATFLCVATGLNLGGGLAFYVHPNVSLHGGVIYRWISFGDAKGVEGVVRDIEESLDGSGVNYQIGITLTF